jgi:hypothetical protein
VYVSHNPYVCPTTSSYDYEASVVNVGMYLVTVTDNDCDNLGITAYSHKAVGGVNSSNYVLPDAPP